MKTAAKVALGLATFGGAVALYTYLKTGLGDQQSPFIPKAVEDKIDNLVTWLNRKYGKRWVDRGLSTLQRAVEATMPAMTSILNSVFAAEQASRGRMKGEQKKAQARRNIVYA